MKHFNIGDKVTITLDQEKPWTYDYEGQVLYVVGINLEKNATNRNYVNEYHLNYTLAEDYPCNKYYGYTDGFYHGDLSLVTT